MESNKNYEDILKNGNLKATKHRYAILEVLERNESPVTAEDLYIKLKEQGVSISLSTVYRGLETLHEKGIVIRSNLPVLSIYNIRLLNNESAKVRTFSESFYAN